MNQNRKRAMDLLLARGRLSGPTRDEILEQCLEATKPKRAPWQLGGWRVWFSALAGAGALAALLVVLGTTGKTRVPTAGFSAKGAAATGVVLEAGCSDGAFAKCSKQNTLVFRVHGAAEGGFLAAYLEPSGGGERIWFGAASSTGSQSHRVPASAQPQVMPEGMMLETVPVGRYTVHLALTRQPLPAEQLLRGGSPGVLATGTTTLEVTP